MIVSLAKGVQNPAYEPMAFFIFFYLGGQQRFTIGQCNGLYATSFLHAQTRGKKAFRCNTAQGQHLL
jgi:hypothetical protein